MPGKRLDTLDVLADRAHDIREELETQEATAYTQGQIEFFREVEERVAEASPTLQPNALLDQVARSFGVDLEEARADEYQASQRQLGIMTAWGLSLGFVEGVAEGARRAARA